MPASRRTLARTFVEQLEKSGSPEKLTRSLAAYLVLHKQAGSADMLIKDIVAELAHRGQVLAEVTTAKPLTDEQRSAIIAKVKDVTDARTVELAEHVDPNIIGGVMLNVPGRELDASISKQLQQLQAI